MYTSLNVIKRRRRRRVFASPFVNAARSVEGTLRGMRKCRDREGIFRRMLLRKLKFSASRQRRSELAASNFVSDSLIIN